MIELKPGVKIKTYTLERQLGKGASGEVWKAYDPFKTVAIKFMNENLMTSANAAKHRARMEREVEAMQKLQHPNIPALYDYDLDFPRPYIVMRFVGGDTYDKLIANGEMQRIPLDRRLDLIREIAMALTAAHENGIIHRDLKPSNLTGIENPYLLDFSISLEQTDADATQRFVGTTLYMSPDGEADRLADNFSFALVAYEILFGKHAIWNPGDPIFNQFIALERLKSGQWHFPSKIPQNELPADLRNANLLEMDRIFSKALGDRQTRYGDLRDLVRDLRAAAIPQVQPVNHEDEDYVPTMMLSTADLQEQMKSNPPIASPAPVPAPVPQPVPVPVPQPVPAPVPAAQEASQPTGDSDRTELEFKTVPYDSLANRGSAAALAGAGDKTELEMPAPTTQSPSTAGGGDRTELEMPAASAPMPVTPPAPSVPTPVPPPAPQAGASFTMMEFEAPRPPQRQAGAPPASGDSYTMMQMETPQQYGRGAGERFTMMEFQAAGQGKQAESFTMMEFQAVSAGGQSGAQPKKKASPLKVIALIISLFLYAAAVITAILLASGAIVT